LPAAGDGSILDGTPRRPGRRTVAKRKTTKVTAKRGKRSTSGKVAHRASTKLELPHVAGKQTADEILDDIGVSDSRRRELKKIVVRELRGTG
jgi:hypothetical protein